MMYYYYFLYFHLLLIRSFIRIRSFFFVSWSLLKKLEKYKPENSIFMKIIRKENPADIVYEDNKVCAPTV